MWLHFVDNAEASSCLVNRSSSVCEGDGIIGVTWGRIQALEAVPWSDQADSSLIPVGGLPRGRLAGPWRVSRLAFPGSLLPAHRRWQGVREGPSVALACKGHHVPPVEGDCSPLLKGGSCRCLLKAPKGQASSVPMLPMGSLVGRSEQGL